PADLLQCQLAAFVVQLLEPIEAVPAVPHHLAGLADIAELFGQLQQTHLHPDNLLLLRHVVVSVSSEGRARSRLAVENRARPPALRRKPTTNVRLSPSSYSISRLKIRPNRRLLTIVRLIIFETDDLVAPGYFGAAAP